MHVHIYLLHVHIYQKLIFVFFCVLVATRSLEAIARCFLASQITWGGDAFTHNSKRIKQLLAKGIDVRSPESLLSIALAELVSELGTLGFTGVFMFMV